MADWIWMLLGVVSGVSRGMGVLDGVVIAFYCLFMIFAVFDLSPLTVCINCSFLHLLAYGPIDATVIHRLLLH